MESKDIGKNKKKKQKKKQKNAKTWGKVILKRITVLL